MSAILKEQELSIRSLISHRAYINRTKWVRGLKCPVCQRKIMAYLEDGHGLDDVMRKMAEGHPEIEYLRKATMDAIRRVTGNGFYDDYIFEHNLWKLRAPIFAPPAERVILEQRWYDFAEQGRELIAMDRELEEVLSRNDATTKLIKHVRSHGFQRKPVKP